MDVDAYIWSEVNRIVEGFRNDIKQGMRERGPQMAAELQKAVLSVLQGKRSGKRYAYDKTYRRNKKTTEIKHTKHKTAKYYTASAPGEAPAKRTGLLRLSFQDRSYVEEGSSYLVHAVTQSSLRLKNGILLGEMLESGTGKMSARPYAQRTIDKAMPKVRRIYKQPYLR